MNDPRLLWWIDRSAGMTALLLLTVVMVMGALSMGRPGVVLGWRATVQSLHRQLPLTASILLAVHIGTAVADSYVPLTPLDVVLPFRSGYRPFWVGLGTLAVDVLATVVVTSLLRNRLGPKAWRLAHWMTYALWPLAVAHALGSGSDVNAHLVRLFAFGCVGAVVLSVGWRFATVPRSTVPRGPVSP